MLKAVGDDFSSFSKELSPVARKLATVILWYRDTMRPGRGWSQCGWEESKPGLCLGRQVSIGSKETVATLLIPPCARPMGNWSYCQRGEAKTSSSSSFLALAWQRQGKPCQPSVACLGQLPISASLAFPSRSRSSLALTPLPQQSKIRCYVYSVKA